MIRLDDKYSGRVNPADANYPDGSVKNETIPNSSDDGTPLDELWGNDIEGFKQAVLTEANITPNDTPETAIDSQWLKGLKKLLKNSITSITGTVAANALTLGLKANALHFRDSALTSGISSPLYFDDLSLVIPDGATLGTVNATESRLYLLAIDNAGTIEPAVVNVSGGVNLDETTLITTVAIDAASDSNNVIYSATARSNVPYRVVGFIESTQAIAGTWVTAPSKIQGAGGNSLKEYGQDLSSIGINIGGNETLYPDGTIKGSNSNGHYIKHPDGTLNINMGIVDDTTSATISGTLTLPITLMDGNFYIRDYSEIGVGCPSVQASAGVRASNTLVRWSVPVRTNTTSTPYSITYNGTEGSGVRYTKVFLKYRWK